MRRVRLLIAGAATMAALVTALAGCASTVPDDGAAPGPSPTPTSGGAMNPPSRLPTGGPLPTTPGKPASGEITVTGQVELLEIEGGCLVLRVGEQAFQLMGVDRQTMRPGARLTVRGRVRSDIATICQVGPVLEVVEVRPA